MRFCFGITTFLLTSAFFTQMIQEKALLPKLLGIDWKVQFCLEVFIGLMATFIGAKMKQHSES